MKYDISNVSISEIGEGIILDYLGDKVNDVKCIDIEGLLIDCFKLQIVYENFAEDDPCRDGFIADGEKTICVWRNGVKQNILFPKRTVVFDKYSLCRSKAHIADSVWHTKEGIMYLQSTMPVCLVLFTANTIRK